MGIHDIFISIVYLYRCNNTGEITLIYLQRKIISLLIISLIGFGSFTTFNYAFAVDNNCKTTIVHIIELRYVLGCIEDRLDVLENAGGGADSTTASNLGSVGEGVFSSEVGDDLQFKKLVAGSGVTLDSNSTRIRINSTGSDDTVCTNVGSGSQIYKDGECNFRTVLGSPDISVTQQTNTITIDYNGTGAGESTVCANTGTGNGLHKAGTNCTAYSLIAGTGIKITNTTDDWTLFNNVTQTIFVSQVSQLKTNIGTVYIDIYVSTFDFENNFKIIDCTVFTEFRVIYSWDYVGVGTQQVRWVDQANNANVFYESPTFTSDRLATDSGWFNKPAFCSTDYQLEWQGKSTTGTDDPTAQGYIIYGR